MVGVRQDERPHTGEPRGAGEVLQVGVVVRLQVQHVVQPPRREVRELVHAQIPKKRGITSRFLTIFHGRGMTPQIWELTTPYVERLYDAKKRYSVASSQIYA